MRADPALAGALGKLASAYAGATCPKVTAVTGKAYGAALPCSAPVRWGLT